MVPPDGVIASKSLIFNNCSIIGGYIMSMDPIYCSIRAPLDHSETHECCTLPAIFILMKRSVCLLLAFLFLASVVCSVESVLKCSEIVYGSAEDYNGDISKEEVLRVRSL